MRSLRPHSGGDAQERDRAPSEAVLGLLWKVGGGVEVNGTDHQGARSGGAP